MKTQVENPLVYISLVNWNSSDKTIQCIETLQNQTYKAFRIVVVDNASMDGSVQKIKASFPNVILLQTGLNSGYAGGHALSVQRALEDHVELLFILNNDTEVEQDALEKLVGAYQTHGDGLYGGVPLLREDNGKPRVQIHYKFLNPDYREILFDWNTFKPYHALFPSPATIQRVAAVNGSCFLLPLSIVKQYGFMDTDYFLYSEEIDYSFRLRNAGVPLWIVPDARIWHESEGSSKSVSVLSDIVQYYRIRNQLVRIKRYGSGWDLCRVMLKNMLLTIFQVVHGRFRRARYLVRAMLDGLAGQLGKTFSPEDYL